MFFNSNNMINVQRDNELVDVLDSAVLKELENEEAHLFAKYGEKVSFLTPLIHSYKNLIKNSDQKESSSIKGKVFMITGGLAIFSSPFLAFFGLGFISPLLLLAGGLAILIGTPVFAYGHYCDQLPSVINELKTSIKNNINFINSDHSDLKERIKSYVEYIDAQIPNSKQYRALILKHTKELYEYDLKVLNSYSNSKWKVIA